ncbi:GMP synthase [Mucilaginibacter sp. PAMB04168]|uniref:type 1 glutamine amidotransferase n=1 Tax=Mucilaginibacter sp. PAMB04168 TaxID=3138567 RepID=UPI0031F69814
MTDTTSIKVAILDLYAGHPNQGMRCFQDILVRYKTDGQLNLSYQVFDVRGANEVPGTEFDIYISSGGPGSPIDSEGSDWENNYFKLIDAIDKHNQTTDGAKKHVLFVCHSFQLMCRRWQLGEVNLRHSPSFGALPVHLTPSGHSEAIFEDLSDPFYAVDSRSWQVINPDENRFKETGATLIAIEKERPYVEYPRAMMAIRFNEYFVGTQFHPEADAIGMKEYLITDEKKKEVIDEHGETKYHEMIERLEDPDKIMHTQNTIIPNFLHEAILSLQEA